jgi:hypothetical protein
MNKEQQELIDEVYEKYSIIAGMSTQVITLTKEEFIHYIRTDVIFSKQWGLSIEERELTFEERWELSKKYGYIKSDCEIPSPDSVYMGINERETMIGIWNDPIVNSNIPTKLITLTYKDLKIESYE